MKYKILALAILATIIYSCSTTKTAPVAQAKPAAETAPVIATVTSADLIEGKSLFDNNCANCHRLYKSNEFTAEEWKPIVARMTKKAHLDEMQGQKIYNYLTTKQ